MRLIYKAIRGSYREGTVFPILRNTGRAITFEYCNNQGGKSVFRICQGLGFVMRSQKIDQWEPRRTLSNKKMSGVSIGVPEYDRSTGWSEEMTNFALWTVDVDDLLCLVIVRWTLDKMNLVVFLLTTCSVHLKRMKIYFLPRVSRPFSNILNNDEERTLVEHLVSKILSKIRGTEMWTDLGNLGTRKYEYLVPRS